MSFLPATRIPDDLVADFTRLREGRRTAAVRRTFLPAFRRLTLLHAAERPPAELHPDIRPLAAEGGRGELGVAPLAPEGGRDGTEDPAEGRLRGAAGDVPSDAGGTEPGEVVVRPYRRGGLVRHVTRDRYLLGDRPLQELVVTERLLRRGIPVPAPLAAVRSEAVPGYRGALVTRRIPAARAAPTLLRGASETETGRILAAMGRAVRRLHAAGGFHPDLNAHNFLLRPSPAGGARDHAREGREPGPGPGTAARDARGEGPGPGALTAALVDFDRALLLDRPLPRPLRAWTRRRIRRSLRKLELAAALAGWEAFLEGYRSD